MTPESLLGRVSFCQCSVSWEGLGGYLVHSYEEFGHAEEVGDCFVDIFGALNEEIIDCLRGGDGCLDSFEELSDVVSSIVFDNVNDVIHSRFHQAELTSTSFTIGSWEPFVHEIDRL